MVASRSDMFSFRSGSEPFGFPATTTAAATVAPERGGVGLRPLPVVPSAPSARSQRPLVALAAVAAIGTSWRRRREVLLGPVAPLLSPMVAEAKAVAPLKAPEVVRELWGKGLRTGEDLSQWKQLLAADCVYEDLYFQDAAKGKDEVMKLIGQKLLPSNSQLIIDDISDGQKSCGFTWHVEEKGVGIGQRGIGYVRLNSAGEVVYVRDLGEPLFKAGELTEKLLEALTKDCRTMKHLAPSQN
eukprot:s738_g3.t1